MSSGRLPDDVRPQASLAAIVAIGAAATFLLFGYEFVRAVSSSLFIGYYGSQRLPYVMALGPVATIAFVYGYGWLLTTLGSRRALLTSTLLAALVITACFIGLSRGVAVASGVLYVFREAYIVVLVEQYWSFINSTVSRRQARLFNGPITGFGSIGAIAGGTLVSLYARSLGSDTLLLFAAASLIPAAVFSDLAYRWGGEPQPAPEEAHGRQGQLALKLFVRNRYLMMLAGLIMLTQTLSTVLDLRFSGLVEQALPAGDGRTAYFGSFYATLNSVAFVLQFAIAPLAMRYLSLRLIHGVIPVVHMAAAAALLVYPSLLTGAAALLLFKAFDYSLFRAAKEMLYIPLTYDARYRAKSVIDAFGYRFAKGGVSGVLAAAAGVWGKLAGATYPVIGLVAAGLWLPLVLKLTAERKPGAAA